MHSTSNPHRTVPGNDISGKNRIRPPQNRGTDAKAAVNTDDNNLQGSDEQPLQAKFPNWTENWPHKRDQLRRRVEHRVEELKKALERAGGADVYTKRSHALQVELQLAEDTIGNGWEHVGEIEAAKLGAWLDHTQFLSDFDPAEFTKSDDYEFPNPANQSIKDDNAELPPSHHRSN